MPANDLSGKLLFILNCFSNDDLLVLIHFEQVRLVQLRFNRFNTFNKIFVYRKFLTKIVLLLSNFHFHQNLQAKNINQ